MNLHIVKANYRGLDISSVIIQNDYSLSKDFNLSPHLVIFIVTVFIIYFIDRRLYLKFHQKMLAK